MLRVVETFSGIGSQAKALKAMGIEYEIINTVEWDISAFYAYDIIHNGEQDLSKYQDWTKNDLLSFLTKHTLSANGKSPINFNYLKQWSEDALRRIVCAFERTKNLGSITDVHANTFEKDIDILTYSFPCQDLSICGAWHGNNSGINRDAKNRSGMLWEIERILFEFKELKIQPPKFLLMENVSNILSSTHRDNFEEWKEILKSLGYINKVYTLDASKFGSPQKRIRTYMISILVNNENQANIVEDYFRNNNLEQIYKTPKPLKDFLRLDYSNAEYKAEADISNPNYTPSRLKIEENNEYVYVSDENCKSVIKTITTKQDRNPTSGLIYYPIHAEHKMKYRNLTPRECFMLMGFDENDFSVLKNHNFKVRKNSFFYSRERYERLAGNSIVVDVLVHLFRQIVGVKNEVQW